MIGDVVGRLLDPWDLPKTNAPQEPPWRVLVTER